MLPIELGTVFLGLALVHRLAHRLAFSPIPLILLVGPALGKGSLLALRLSEPFIRTTAEISALLRFYAGLRIRRPGAAGSSPRPPPGQPSGRLPELRAGLSASAGVGLSLALGIGRVNLHRLLQYPPPSDRRAGMERPCGSARSGLPLDPGGPVDRPPAASDGVPRFEPARRPSGR
jgi:hypothetical protein